MSFAPLMLLTCSSLLQAGLILLAARTLESRGRHSAVSYTALCSAISFGAPLAFLWAANAVLGGRPELQVLVMIPFMLVMPIAAVGISWRVQWPVALVLISFFAVLAVSFVFWIILDLLKLPVFRTAASTLIYGSPPMLAWNACAGFSLLRWAAKTRAPAGLCRKCLYHLVGLPIGAPCPECGTPTTR